MYYYTSVTIVSDFLLFNVETAVLLYHLRCVCVCFCFVVVVAALSDHVTRTIRLLL